MKLIFFPMLIFAFIQGGLADVDPSFYFIKLTGMLTGLILIPVLFYTAMGIFGPTADWFNIAIFFIAAALAFHLECRLMASDDFTCLSAPLSVGIMALIAFLFVIFTFLPPRIPLFKDPVSGEYGI